MGAAKAGANAAKADANATIAKGAGAKAAVTATGPKMPLTDHSDVPLSFKKPTEAERKLQVEIAAQQLLFRQQQGDHRAPDQLSGDAGVSGSAGGWG